MSFLNPDISRLIVLLLLGAILPLSGCHRSATREQKALQAELRQALREHSYEKAVELARRALQSRPHDNGSWDRLVQAQFGMRDFNSVKRTLTDWRTAIRHPSPNLDEYTGDLAVEENDLAAAVQAWSKVIAATPKNSRVLEKIARAEKARHHWSQENSAWTAYLAVQDNAMARINRAMCRRRLHRWEEALADLHRAQELTPDEPEVQQGIKLFERLGKFLAEIRELDAALAVTPNDTGLLGDRALMFLRGEDYELALDDSEAAAKSGPWAVRSTLFQAIALIALDRSDECEKLLVQKSIRLASLPPEFLETMSRLDAEISVERNNAELYVSRAWQLNEIGQPALALQDAEHAAQLDAKSAGACVERSYALMKLGRGREAFDQIKRATDLDSTLSTAWEYRGELEMERGELLSAIESLTHAIEMNQTAIALQKREQCYRRLGLYVKAEQDHRALEELSVRATK